MLYSYVSKHETVSDNFIEEKPRSCIKQAHYCRGKSSTVMPI